MDFLQQDFLGNTGKEYLLFLLFFFILFLVFKIFKNSVLVTLKKLTQKTKNDFDDLFARILNGISSFFFWVLAFYLAVQTLELPSFLDRALYYFFVLFVVWELIKVSREIIGYFIDLLTNKNDESKKTVFKIVKLLANILVYIAALLILLSLFGVDITALVAGLGVGGIAIAFALKEILADLFSYFTIMLDQPIREGDYINLGEKKGTVKKIGVKTTRLVSPDGGEVIVSNTLISSGLFDNSGTREYRRTRFNLGVAYDTSTTKLRKIEPSIKSIIDKEESSEFLRVFFKNFGESALEFYIDYKLFTDGYEEYARARERINFAILEFCEKEGIEIAYPTMTIHQK